MIALDSSEVGTAAQLVAAQMLRGADTSAPRHLPAAALASLILVVAAAEAMADQLLELEAFLAGPPA
ncbi:MAG: hypothetical protein HQL38_15830 [Alphaproteobacteria bacterium]|nr:hypothetical protein [Alphaproteobacteria bacterium]